MPGFVASPRYDPVMHAVDVRDLRVRLDDCLRRAAAGETILVTDAGHVVARLSPARQRCAVAPRNERLAEGVREGWYLPPLDDATIAPQPGAVAPLVRLLADLDEDRADR
jgi:antitoxin (DNA-binding transcriptional repressor) of toxin-antitoxin stability system